jgi:hypothetical protein
MAKDRILPLPKLGYGNYGNYGNGSHKVLFPKGSPSVIDLGKYYGIGPF